MSIQTVNPFTGKLIKDYPSMSKTDVNEIISNCHQDYLVWSEISFATRATKMLKVGELLRKHKNRLATVVADEMGKPTNAGIAEIEKCALVCEYYAKNTEKLLQPQLIKTDLQKSFVTYRPQGIIFAIMPWNYPFWQVFRFAAPNLMAGNGCLLKHAPISTGTALEIEKLFREAGFPNNIFRTLVIGTDLAPTVIADRRVIGVTLTGSERAGIAVSNEASKYLKKAVLELGGNDPYVILEDADLAHAAKTCVSARLSNSGQICIAAKRIIVVDEVFEDFQNKVIAEMKGYIMGDPMDSKTTMGPLARNDLRQTVHNQVQKSIQSGAKLVVGGEIPTGPGFFYPPTLLTDVMPGTPAFDDEIFGPVVTLIHANNENHAIELANHTRYGLGAAVFTKDILKGEDIAVNKLNAGTCSVNTAVHSDPRLPFGGIKHSGYGRELGANGLKSFLNIKTIQIN